MTERLRLVPYPARVVFRGGTLKCDAVRLSGKNRVNGLSVVDLFERYGVKTCENGVTFVYGTGNCTVYGNESYTLEISADGITAEANSDAGLFYAIVSLAQLLHNYKNDLPICSVTDSPAIGYRGFMLDCGRYFFPKEDVMRIIDLCALHKINAFHWHLTEDQGWRISIDEYPELTKKGSMRTHTNFGFRKHGGYYTREDATEISEYCKARNIEIVPEVDVPGHSQAALACYPWLGCFDRKLNVATHSGVKHDIMCAGKESTYAFVDAVLTEIVDIFGNNMRYLHIGGDEAVKMRWKLCPYCQKKIKDAGLNDEEDLQAYFTERIAGYVIGKGYIPVIWNGVRCPKNTVVQYWDSTGGIMDAEEASRGAAGYINSDSRYAYLDLPYADISLEKSYSFVPVSTGGEGKAFKGAEAALWSEYVPDLKTAYKRMLPRLCALSDSMWGGYGGDFREFCDRLDAFEEYLRSLGYDGASRKQAMPGKIRAFFQKLWFERRQLHWQGLHNLLCDAYVGIKYGKKR